MVSPQLCLKPINNHFDKEKYIGIFFFFPLWKGWALNAPSTECSGLLSHFSFHSETELAMTGG